MNDTFPHDTSGGSASANTIGGRSGRTVGPSGSHDIIGPLQKASGPEEKEKTTMSHFLDPHHTAVLPIISDWAETQSDMEIMCILTRLARHAVQNTRRSRKAPRTLPTHGNIGHKASTETICRPRSDRAQDGTAESPSGSLCTRNLQRSAAGSHVVGSSHCVALSSFILLSIQIVVCVFLKTSA